MVGTPGEPAPRPAQCRTPGLWCVPMRQRRQAGCISEAASRHSRLSPPTRRRRSAPITTACAMIKPAEMERVITIRGTG